MKARKKAFALIEDGERIWIPTKKKVVDQQLSAKTSSLREITLCREKRGREEDELEHLLYLYLSNPSLHPSEEADEEESRNKKKRLTRSHSAHHVHIFP